MNVEVVFGLGYFMIGISLIDIPSENMVGLCSALLGRILVKISLKDAEWLSCVKSSTLDCKRHTNDKCKKGILMIDVRTWTKDVSTVKTRAIKGVDVYPMFGTEHRSRRNEICAYLEYLDNPKAGVAKSCTLKQFIHGKLNTLVRNDFGDDAFEEIREHVEKCLAEKVDKHCLYVGFEWGICLCMLPGMECVDAKCGGYEKCSNYTEGTRKIETAERLKYPVQLRLKSFKEGDKVRITSLNEERKGHDG